MRWLASGPSRACWPGPVAAPGLLACSGSCWPWRPGSRSRSRSRSRATGTAVLFLAARGPGRALLTRAGPRLGLTGPRLARAAGLLERRGWPALAAGRTTPGLRTVTVVAAASSGVRAGRALPALVLFLQAHMVLGYALGPAAREQLEQARVPVLAATATLLLRRRRPRVTRVLAEDACPACLALGLVRGGGT